MKIVNMAENWREQALCRQFKDIDFYSDEPLERKRSKAICKNCKVASHCLKFAIDTNEAFGVWGGYTQRERRTIRRKYKNLDIQIAQELVIKNGNQILH